MIRNHTGRPDAPSDVIPGRRERRGFALPMAILIIAFLTVTIAAAYAATSAEMATNSAQRGESRAYMVAQAGLESFLARRNENGFCPTVPRAGQTTPPCGFPPSVQTESTTIRLPSGFAEIVARRVRVGTMTRPAIYLIRSRGVDTLSKAIGGSSRDARAERTVAQLVYWNVNQVQVLSGWTSANGLDKVGTAGTISGHDNNDGTGAGCPPKQASVAGVAVPNGDYSQNGNFAPMGNPPIQYLGTQAQTNASIKIDWNGIMNGDRLQPDFTFSSGAAAIAGWPPNMSDPYYYPVIRVNGDLSLGNGSPGGKGTLIVMGNLTIHGDNLWKGIIMVGGTMKSTGDNTMLGATMSGLNELLTTAQLAAAQAKSSTFLPAHPDAALAKGMKTFQYDSCEVAKAAAGLASYSVYPNAWMDNFVTY